MKPSAKSEYGVIALLELALHDDQGPLQVRAIAERRSIPARFLEQVMSSLKKGGLVKSIRGAQGGYRLAKPPSKIRLSDVIQAIEGPIIPVGIGSESKQIGWQELQVEDRVVMEVWEKVKISVIDVLSSITLHDMCERKRELEKQRVIMYHI
ncbi:MAG: Rrf2 family transcriptional regulator [Candidatus Tectomicrobia bacterium]|nr:Rrf2 family transcriptional regulator [Candidatus Tectomicrobia bacterium]